MHGDEIMGLNPSNRFQFAVVVALCFTYYCYGQVPIPTDVEVTCLNFNCSLSWSAPENITSSDDVTYTVDVWDSVNITTNTDIFIEIASCVNIRQTECNLVTVVPIDTLASTHFVAVSAIVNGERSEIVEESFLPKYRATVDSPDVNITELEPDTFTVDFSVPLSPYVNPNTGEFYRIDELPPFQGGFFRSKIKFYSSLFAVQPDGELTEIEARSDVTNTGQKTFRDLHPYSSYRLKISSWYTSLHVSKESKEAVVLNIMTPEDVPSEGPIITHIVRESPNCSSPDISPVILTWTPPPLDEQNGNITHYSIRYMTPGYDVSQAIVKNCSGNSLSVELELLRWQAYEFAVLVCNSVGCAESLHKTLFNIQAIRKGSKCRNISVDHRTDYPLTITWEPPANFSECITSYLVTIDGAKGSGQQPITQMVYDTYLQVNLTLASGNYKVVVRSFVRSGFDTASRGEEASAEFIIEEKTIKPTNHLILPMVITFSFLLSGILVAIVICCKWILKPFDFHLEKTRALKVARAYHPEQDHYRHDEEEVYDSLPGSRRTSRTSNSSFRLNLSNARFIFRNDSTSSFGRRLPSQTEAPLARLPSHVEEPNENEALLENITYSPISSRKTKKLESGDHTTSQPFVQIPISSSSGASSGRYPMLTIEFSRDNSSQRVVKWKAGGVESDFDEEEDPFDLPRAEDFDEADVVRDTNNTTSSSNDTRTPKGIKYSNLTSSDSTSSGESNQKLNYAALASQPSEGSEPVGGLTPFIIGDVNPALFSPVIEEGSSPESDGEPDQVQYAQLANVAAASDNDDPESVQYSQLASAQPANRAATIPAPAGDANIHPYSRIANNGRNNPPQSAGSAISTSNNEGYAQIGHAEIDNQPSPVVRDTRTNGDTQPYLQLDGSSSPSIASSPATSRSGSADSGSGYVSPGSLPPGSHTTQNPKGRSFSTPNQSASSCDGSSSPSTNRSLSTPAAGVSSLADNRAESPTTSREQNVQPDCNRRSNLSSSNNDILNQSANNTATAEPDVQNIPIPAAFSAEQSPSSLAILRRDDAETSSSMQLLPSGSFSPNTRTRQLRRERSASDPPYRSVRVPIIHTPGSPLLPSRALDVCVSDSDTSEAESLDALTNHSNGVATNGLGYVPNGVDNANPGANPVGCNDAAAQPPYESNCQSDLDAPEVSIHEQNGHSSHNGSTQTNGNNDEDSSHNYGEIRTEETLQSGDECVSKGTNKAVDKDKSAGLNIGAEMNISGYVPR